MTQTVVKINLFICFLIWLCSAGNLVLNELMINPESGGEWIEIHNPDTAIVDIRGWQITDDNDFFKLDSQQAVTVPSRDFVILAQDSTELKAAFPWIECTILDPSGWLILNNDGDIVVLKDAQGALVDSIHFQKTWFDPGLPKGISLERRDPLGSSSTASNWALSINPNGCTPGFSNSVEPNSCSEFKVEAGPKLFRPQEGERFVVRSYLPGSGNLIIDIYSLTGQKICNLHAGHAWDQGTSSWDGRTDWGTLAPRGTYVLLVRFETADKTHRYKQSLVLAPGR